MTEKEILILLRAHRAAIASISWAIEDRFPGALTDIIASLVRFEKVMRTRNETDGAIQEIRRIREGLEIGPGPAKPSHGKAQ